ncbi:TIGR03086 family metal-binding protein [Actinophytocola sp.]|uniref:TIGR03086 family metal-binding protein n=1 Tax=Actinophytocola sp. TaxID=1872138 RepID=UPI002EDA23C1
MTQLTGIDVAVLERGYAATADVLAAIPAGRWDAPSPCAGWTVRDVAEHLVDSLDFFAGTVSGAQDSGRTDLLAGFRDATGRCLAAFARPEVLAAEHPFPGGVLPGWVIAHISLSESLVHGWDLATGAGLPYAPDAGVVAAVAALSDGPAPDGAFADPVPVPVGASPFEALLGKLGREVR